MELATRRHLNNLILLQALIRNNGHMNECSLQREQGIKDDGLALGFRVDSVPVWMKRDMQNSMKTQPPEHDDTSHFPCALLRLEMVRCVLSYRKHGCAHQAALCS